MTANHYLPQKPLTPAEKSNQMIDMLQNGDNGPKCVRIFQSMGVLLKPADFKTLRQKMKDIAVSYLIKTDMNHTLA